MMDMERLTGIPGERLAALEIRASHIESKLDKMETQVDEMHAILMQARGFRWALMVFIGAISFVTGSILPWVVHKL